MVVKGCAKIGCGCIGGGILTLLTIVALFAFGIMAYLKSTEPYKHAVDVASQNPEVRERLGSPLTSGMLVNGSISFENNDGTVDFTMSVKGPDGSGELRVRGTSEGPVWTYDELTLTPDDGSGVIDLRATDGLGSVETYDGSNEESPFEEAEIRPGTDLQLD